MEKTDTGNTKNTKKDNVPDDTGSAGNPAGNSSTGTGGISFPAGLCRITLLNGSGQTELAGNREETLYEVIAGSGVDFDAPCGGMGLCGKCKVRIISPAPGNASKEEMELIGPEEIMAGYRLACRYSIKGDTVVRLPLYDNAPETSEGPETHKDLWGKSHDGYNSGSNSSNQTSVSSSGGVHKEGSGLAEGTAGSEPFINITPISPDTPSLIDQRSLLCRVSDSIRKSRSSNTENPPGSHTSVQSTSSEFITSRLIISRLSDLAAEAAISGQALNLSAVHTVNSILSIEPAGSTYLRTAGHHSAEVHAYGVAVDIGTTTVAAYLVDFSSGKAVDSVSALNTQKTFGADVISRITFTIDNKKGLEILRLRITSQISNMIARLSSRNKIQPDNIYCISIAGNTTMLHLLTGANPAMIASSPFIPAFTGGMMLKAREIGLETAPDCLVLLLPSISAYVGADITAGILSCGMFDNNGINLLIDIGTNGEIVLGDRKRMVCCSTAAGPAFEGAGIRNGLGGVKGAINSITYRSGQPGGLTFTTISNAPPAGICGSGIIDAAAILLANGIIGSSGAFDTSGSDSDRCHSIPDDLAARSTTIDGHKSFMLAERSDGARIALTQRDLREIQLAKAAIAAGIRILIRKMGISASAIEKVFLAGGFGNYINKDSAVSIGLIPESLTDKIRPVGNAAGKGAILALLDRKLPDKAAALAGMAEYIELSALSEFQDEYVECMFFGTI